MTRQLRILKNAKEVPFIQKLDAKRRQCFSFKLGSRLPSWKLSSEPTVLGKSESKAMLQIVRAQLNDNIIMHLKYGVRMWARFFCFGIEPSGDTCEENNES
jgi:hypothetical protein